MQINRMKCATILAFSLLLILSGSALSESELDITKYDNPPVTQGAQSNLLEEADKRSLEYRLAQENYIFMEVMILAVMAVSSLIIVLTFMKMNGTCKPRDMMVTAGLILIIFSTIILVLVADSQEQISAAIGVLGAIAGYLFGSAASRRSEEKVESSQRQEAK